MIDSLINSLRAQLSCLETITAEEKARFTYASLQIPIEQTITLAPTNMSESFFLTKPDTNFSLLGLSSLLTLKAKGSKRFNSIKSDYSEILNKHFFIPTDDNELTIPIAFLAFAFDENDPMDNNWEQFPNTLLTIPTVLIKETDSCQTLVVNIELKQGSYDDTFKNIAELLNQYLKQIDPTSPFFKGGLRGFKPSCRNASLPDNGSLPAESSWQTLTQKAITEIKSGRFDKLVTSRQYSMQTEDSISVTDLVQKLTKHYPTCTILSYQLSDKNIVAVSPECLLTLQHPNIQSDAIGGTIVRNKPSTNNSSNPSLPLLFNQSLTQVESASAENKKLLKEHAFIAQDIYQCLDPLCNTLKMPVSPFLMKLHNMYHLETPVQGKLMDEYGLFDVIETLHPTPAVAGFPAQEARQWLIENENYHRGWYTGAFGWLDGKQNGELSVMLRCALIKDNQVDLFAGAGLVAESDPDVEWLETELKMQTIMEML